MRVAFDQLTAQEVKTREEDAHAMFLPGKAAIQWHFHDEMRVWLSVNTFNRADEWVKEGYNPSYTYLVSQYKPIVKKMGNGQWQITFTSEIAQGLP
jgi:hypothetical protein